MPKNIPDSENKRIVSGSIEVKINQSQTDATTEQVTGTSQSPEPQREIGGPAGLEPTRYGDWEVNGRCSDF